MRKKRTSESETVIEGGVGYQIHHKGGIATFRVEGLEDPDREREDDFRRLYRRFINENTCLTVGSYQVPLWGEGHNLYPQEVSDLVNENKLLPGILRKQEDFLYGRGPMLYREEVQDGKMVRVSVTDSAVQQWLESWESQGMDDYRTYLRCLIADFYRVRTCVTRFHFSRGRRTERYQTGSVRALSYIGADEARLAAKGEAGEWLTKRVSRHDCRYVITGNWANIGGRQDYEVWHRLDAARPFDHPTAVAFDVLPAFGKRVYAYNEWFSGLREWVRASNLTPRYLNSYLKNALNAHIHVKIPETWVSAHRNRLEELCRQNLNESNPELRVKEYKGVSLIDTATGRPFRYSHSMLEDLVANELEKITKLLSGEGKNQGKLYATTKMGQEGWEFADFPGKFKGRHRLPHLTHPGARRTAPFEAARGKDGAAALADPPGQRLVHRSRDLGRDASRGQGAQRRVRRYGLPRDARGTAVHDRAHRYERPGLHVYGFVRAGSLHGRGETALRQGRPAARLRPSAGRLSGRAGRDPLRRSVRDRITSTQIEKLRIAPELLCCKGCV